MYVVLSDPVSQPRGSYRLADVAWPPSPLYWPAPFPAKVVTIPDVLTTRMRWLPLSATKIAPAGETDMPRIALKEAAVAWLQWIGPGMEGTVRKKKRKMKTWDFLTRRRRNIRRCRYRRRKT